MDRRYATALAALLIFFVVSPLWPWYYFIATNGERTRWVFNSSCNSGNSNITLYVDSDTPTNRQDTLTTTTAYGVGVIPNWNQPYGGASIGLLNGTIDTSTSMSANSVVSYYNSPQAGRIWVVYDSDGSVFSRFGIDPSVGVLGIGLSFALDGASPQNICSGLILINAYYINATADPVRLYKTTVLHELGHSLGFAHSVSAGNKAQTVNTAVSSYPVMYPFSFSTSPAVLQNDDFAGAKTVYGQ